MPTFEEGETVMQRGWSGRRAAALAKRAATKDSFTTNRVRGAHIRLEAAKVKLLDPTLSAADRQAFEDELKHATKAFADASAAHEAFERGDVESEVVETPEEVEETGEEGGGDANDEGQGGFAPAKEVTKGRKPR